MSVVVAAIVAGATAALTKVSSDLIVDLYGQLKKQLSDISEVDYSGVEKDPQDISARRRLEAALSKSKIGDSPDIRKLAVTIVEEALRRNVPVDKAWLVDVKDLEAKGDISFANIDTSALLLKADSVVTDGAFRVENVRHRSSAYNRGGSWIDIGSLTANSVNISSIVNAIPRGVRIALVTIIMLIVAIQIYNYFTRRASFDAAVGNLFATSQNEYQSSVNSVLNLPSSIRSTRDNAFWTAFGSQWTRHFERLEGFFRPIATGLSSGEMSATGKADRLCSDIGNLVQAHYAVIARLSEVPSITVDHSLSGNAPELSVFGPVIAVPSTYQSESFFEQACSGDLNNLKNPPDTRTEDEKKRDRIANIDQQIEELKKLKEVDIEVRMEELKLEFVRQLAGYYISQGMFRPDAIAQAKRELEEALGGGGINYLVPGMNDIVDEIRQAEQLRARDLDEEIRVLTAERAQIETS
ncbi:hypothetical protein ACFX5Q_17985 [Mesorhizobium sp. IMUNJ 23033]|uniref:hypothetical protein n=1 Tax=Mesorhizobium sp. IMUNJ 23033 TaxID=3378039 RepID=UPI0038510D49